VSKYLKDLRAERKTKFVEMSRIIGDGSRSLSNADRERFDSLKLDVGSIDSRINSLVRDVPDDRGRMPGRKRGKRTERDEAFTRYLRSGDNREYRVDGPGLTSAPNDAGVSAGATGYDAGYMIPQGFWRNLQVAMKAFGGLSNDYRYVQTDTGNPTPWPTVDPTSVTGTWLGASTENTALSLQNYYQFGQGMLNAWTVVVGPFLASLQLIQDSAFDVDQFVAERIGEALGRSIAAIAVSGTGAGQPLGIITALNAKGALSGASGGYYQLTAGTTVKTFAAVNPTELSGNILSPTSLLGMIQGVDPAYYRTAKWYLSSAMAWNLRSVVDSNGRPILNFMNGFDADDVTSGTWSSNTPVAKLFGFPVVLDNNLPALAASTTGGAVFGALDHAMVYRVVRNDARIVADMNTGNMMRLDQRYADLLAVGYLGYVRTDIRSNDLRAAVTVKAAAT
jgi:HK97 family phage major capsid protein